MQVAFFKLLQLISKLEKGREEIVIKSSLFNI